MSPNKDVVVEASVALVVDSMAVVMEAVGLVDAIVVDTGCKVLVNVSVLVVVVVIVSIVCLMIVSSAYNIFFDFSKPSDKCLSLSRYCFLSRVVFVSVLIAGLREIFASVTSGSPSIKLSFCIVIRVVVVDVWLDAFSI
jgi:hypothetical protein